MNQIPGGAMLGWLCVTLGVAFGSALVPLISIEVFVIGLASSEPGVHWLAIGAAVAIGQITGKLLYYLAARGSIRLPAFLHDRLHRERSPSARRDRWQRRTKRLRMRLEALRERCHRHPHWMTGTYGVSAIVGMPPFMATTVLAGLARMRLCTFLAAGLLGRWLRFSVLAACPALFAGWWQP
jgi:membrane protein YqaA with SNARE-associated domain